MAILRGLCTVKQITDLVWPDEPYNADSVPTVGVIEAWVDEDIDLLYPVLRAAGIIVPVVNAEVKRIVAVIQSKRVAGRVENFQHFDHGQVTSPWGDRLLEDAQKDLDLLLTGMLLPYDATTTKRIVLPQQVLWSKVANETWDSSQEDKTPQAPMFKIKREF